MFQLSKRSVIYLAILFAIATSTGWFVVREAKKTEESFDKVCFVPVKHTKKVPKYVEPKEMSWERVTEIIELMKTGGHDDQMLAKGVKPGEYGLAQRMETARLNSLADGKEYPWRGNMAIYGGGTSSNPGKPWERAYDPKLVASIPPKSRYIQLKYLLLPDGKTIEKDVYIQAVLRKDAVCVWPKSDTDERQEDSCSSYEKYKSAALHIGMGVQLYGTKKNNVISISKVVFTDSDSLPFYRLYENLK